MLPNPYAPPQQAAQPSPGAHASGLAALGMVALGALAASMALRWVLHGMVLADLKMPRPWPSLLVGVGALVRVAGAVLLLVWIYRAAANATRMKRPGMEMSPALCVGSFFIPVAGLWFPYRAMAQITMASDPRGRGVPPGSVILWWVTYLAGNFVGVLGPMLFNGAEPGAVRTSELLSSVLLSVAMAALYVTMRFVWQGQQQWSEQPAPAGRSDQPHPMQEAAR
jgi:hypothetical protein